MKTTPVRAFFASLFLTIIVGYGTVIEVRAEPTWCYICEIGDLPQECVTIWNIGFTGCVQNNGVCTNMEALCDYSY